MTTCTSAVVTGERSVEIREFDVPEIGPDEGLLRVELGGVCGSDGKAYKGEHHPDALPAVLGHEILGRIDRIGEELARELGVEAGDRVVVEGPRRCGSCEICLSGELPKLCEREGSYGWTPVSEPPGFWGSHGEYVFLTSNTTVHPVDESVPAEAAVLGVAVTGNSIRWLEAGCDEFLGKSILIQGPGPQGLSMTIVARKMGFSPIVVTGVPGDERRLELAEGLGADLTVCSEPGNLTRNALDALGGPADVVVNLTGAAGTIQGSIDLVGLGGTVVYPNVVDDSASSTVELNDLVYKDADIVGTLSRKPEYVERALTVIERDPEPFARLVSHRYTIDEAERAYRVAAGLTEESPLKVALDPWQ